MGLVSAMLGVGGGVGVVMSGLIADHASWRLLFVVGAAVGILALGLVGASCRPPEPEPLASRPRGRRDAVRASWPCSWR